MASLREFGQRPLPGDVADLRRRVLVWWVVWAGIFAALLSIYLLLGRGAPPLPAAGHPLLDVAGFVPLFVSVVIRWLVLPRYTEPGPAFVMFVIGLALAEACGVLGIFLGGPYREDLTVLGLLGIAQYLPFYARRLYQPRAEGFIPNR